MEAQRSSARENGSSRSPRTLNRRSLIGMAGVAAVSLGGAAAARAQGTPASTPVSDGHGGQLLYSSIVPDIPPAVVKIGQPYKSYDGKPGRGGKVRLTHLVYTDPAVGKNDNQFWKELDKRLNVELDVNQIPNVSFDEKIATLFASGDLGDLFYVNPNEGGAKTTYDAIQHGAFTDLTDVLNTDARKRYPNLDRIPEAMWRDSSVNGKIFGVPNPLPHGWDMTAYRQDWLAKAKTRYPTNAAQTLDMLKAFHEGDPNQNGKADTWAAPNWAMWMVNHVHRVPLKWRLNDDGTLTSAYETDEQEQALEFMKAMWDSGVIHPDATTLSGPEYFDIFKGGVTGTLNTNLANWWGATGLVASMDKLGTGAQLANFMPPGVDGGKGVIYRQPSYWGMTGIPAKAGKDKDRVDELLRILDYFLCPFGSEEYIFNNFGLEGVHHTVADDGSWKLTDKGNAEIAQLLMMVKGDALYLFYPGYLEQGTEALKIYEQASAYNLDNPVNGHYSVTELEKGPVLTKLINDEIASVVLGRKDLSTWKKTVDEWRKRGGDDIRKDYETSLKQSG